ncbi:Acireductone dioxygenase [Gloeopeniophorella convolvens]|nr:Acireductone dioxygenase [Gloeopeniophorella convolvens]
MRAWYYDNLEGHPRLPHHSGREVGIEKLEALKVRLWKVPVDDEGKGWEEHIARISKENDFKNNDTISVTREGLGDEYEEILKEFFDEHLHEDDETRFVVKGAGYYDVREHPTDEWIRMYICKGDLVSIPKGIYHRFMLDEQNEIAGLRLWKNVPNWTPVPRTQESDKNTFRIGYLDSLRDAGISVPQGWFEWVSSTINRVIFRV